MTVPQVVFVGRGSFARSVHAIAGGLAPSLVGPLRGTRIVDDAAVLLVATRSPLAVAYQLDEAAFERRIHFSTICLWGTGIQLGPTVIPGKGPCYHCFIQRQRQHASGLVREDAILSHEERTDPPDILVDRHLSMIAGYQSARMAALLATGRARPGAIVRIPAPPAPVIYGCVAGIPGCPRCRRKTDMPSHAETSLRRAVLGEDVWRPGEVVERDGERDG